MRHTIFALLGAVALFGCNTTGTGGGDDGDGDGDGNGSGNGGGEETKAPEFPTGTGQAPQAAKAYPAAPFGMAPGSIIANYKLIGFPNAMKDSTTLKEIQLADFYNPTGDGVYEEGSVFEAGTPKPKALLINIGSTWCPPCNHEADVVLPPLYLKYKPMGGEFLLQLQDGPTPGINATTKSLYNWTQKYDVDYPGTIDPAAKLMALSESDAFPTNFIINTRTMMIVDVIAGSPEPGSSFFKTFEKVLAGDI